MWTNPKVLLSYLPLLMFLGLGLRPLLEATGLYHLFQAILLKRDDAAWEKINKTHRQKVNQKERSNSLKQRRVKDPRLPKNW
ncbi:hypothetical protein [Pseudoteredinibacter isoporae]|uniref:hypothetical protein n=1 Tax=Pseudoteredinibacter isoporae TaxID=570281 RepID=UPI001C879F97|nr:hypothetical protein [Pseudoteredinibacter isoporae]